MLALAVGFSSEQSPECVEYVKCQKALDLMTQTDMSELTAQYEAGGSCWGSDALTAHSCTAGCVAAMTSAPSIFDQVPVECGGDFVLPPLKASETLGPSGGVIEVLGLALEVPAGALPDDVEITVENTATFQRWNDTLSYTHLYRFEPDGLSFAAPVSVTLKLPASVDGEGASVYWSLPGDDESFEELGGTFEGETLTAQVTHFSRGFGGQGSDEHLHDAGPDPDGRGGPRRGS